MALPQGHSRHCVVIILLLPQKTVGRFSEKKKQMLRSPHSFSEVTPIQLQSSVFKNILRKRHFC